MAYTHILMQTVILSHTHHPPKPPTPSGGWQDPVLQELLGADNPAATITMSFVDRTRTQLFETYGLVEVGGGW